MPRDFAKVNVGMWADPEFRRLPPAAQHLYLTLWTAPELTYVGVHDWRPARMTGLSHGFTADHVRTVAACLSARHFLVIDEDTEEVLLRSWIRFDEVLKQPRLAVSCLNAYASTASPSIRAVIVHELNKLRENEPNLPAWRNDRLLEILSHPAASAKAMATPDDPFGHGFTPGFAMGLPENLTSVSPKVSVPPTTATATATNTSTTTDTASRKRAARIDPDFALTDELRSWAESKHLGHLDLAGITESFVDYWLAQPGQKGTKTDWPATWRNWVRREGERIGGGPRKAVVDRRPEGWR